MRWAIPLVLLSAPAFGQQVHCLAVSSYVCGINGCEPTSLIATTVDVDLDTGAMHACWITNCADFTVTVADNGRMRSDHPEAPAFLYSGQTMTSVDQYGATVQIAYFECR